MSQSDVFDRLLEKQQSSVLPIFMASEVGAPELLGSGVLLDIEGTKFLLTAAHVTDCSDLLVPGKESLMTLNESHCSMKLPPSGNRNDDRYDIAYYRLEEEFVSKLHADFVFLSRENVDLFDVSFKENPYTMIGYPARKGSVKGDKVSGEIYTFTGGACEKKIYEKHGYNIEHHLLLKFRNKKSFHLAEARRRVAPNPEGMSGGGVFSIAKKVNGSLVVSASPKLVGILMMYEPSEGTFMITRLNCFIRVIQKNNPHLPITRTENFSHQGLD